MVEENNQKKILKILSDGKIHSGAALGEQLGLTRGGIWKLIRQFKSLGIEIEAKSNKGYCIPGGVELYNLKEMKQYLNPNYYPYLEKTIIFDEINSTNTFLIQEAIQHKNTKICLAEHQSAGRGRFNRQWMSPFGRNVILSLLWQFNCDVSELSGLSLVIAIAIHRALKRLGATDVSLKWPNDVLWNSRKLAGTLIDLRGESNNTCDAVIGVGLNVHLPDEFKSQMLFPLVDMAEITKNIINKNQVTAYLIDEMIAAILCFQSKGFKFFQPEWEKLDINCGKIISLENRGSVFQGKYCGVNEKGCLILEMTGGEKQVFSSGEVSFKC